MLNDNRITFDDHSRIADRFGRDAGVLPIGDILAELLTHYQIKLSEHGPGRFPSQYACNRSDAERSPFTPTVHDN